jgi:hypothetical protein
VTGPVLRRPVIVDRGALRPDRTSLRRDTVTTVAAVALVALVGLAPVAVRAPVALVVALGLPARNLRHVCPRSEVGPVLRLAIGLALFLLGVLAFDVVGLHPASGGALAALAVTAAVPLVAAAVGFGVGGPPSRAAARPVTGERRRG